MLFIGIVTASTSCLALYRYQFNYRSALFCPTFILLTLHSFILNCTILVLPSFFAGFNDFVFIIKHFVLDVMYGRCYTNKCLSFAMFPFKEGENK